MKILNFRTFIWVLGGIWIGLSPYRATAFSLDLFDSVDNDDPADLYISGTFIGPQTYTGQEVHLNQPFPEFGLHYNQEESDTGLANVEGGNRHIKIDTSNGGDGEIVWKVNTSNTTLDLDTNAGTTTGGTDPKATIVWNGSSNIDFIDLTADAALNLDLERDGDGDDSIGIRISSADHPGTIDLTLYDGSNSYTYTQSSPLVTAGTPQTVYFDFATYTSNGVNINHVDYISLEISSNSEQDLKLDFVETARIIPFNFSPSLGIFIGGIWLSLNMFPSKEKKRKR